VSRSVNRFSQSQNHQSQSPISSLHLIMAKIRERFVFDKNGRPAGVHLDFVECRDLLQDLEAEACARAFDRAKDSGEEAIPFEQALAGIESRRL
jgi:hypothetical protein